MREYQGMDQDAGDSILFIMFRDAVFNEPKGRRDVVSIR